MFFKRSKRPEPMETLRRVLENANAPASRKSIARRAVERSTGFFTSRARSRSSETFTICDVPRKCVLLIDVSPSMFANDWPPNRLKAAQEAAKAFAVRRAEVSPTSRIAIVAYGENAHKACGLTRADQVESICRAIDSVNMINSTNITAGLEAASGILGHFKKDAQVIVLSDGHHNTGVSPINLADRMRRCAIIECVGIGGQPSAVDEALMKAIASAYPDGRKRYRWIGDKAELVEHYRDLAGRLSREP